MSTDEFFMKRALQIAMNGAASAKPNPSVGAVIVCNNKIIGEGFTSAYGGPHAEVNAIAAVKDQNVLKKSTIFVTLEPCSHFGKTPPCADLIVKHQLNRVVIGCLDSNIQVAGKGVKRLQDVGITVEVGILEKECRQHHLTFFTNHEKKRPYIILKWAQTKDGFIAPKSKNNKAPIWISNAISQQLVHQWRAEEHAILVGTNTVLEDNPKLNIRSWKGTNPVRIVLDRQLKIPKTFSVLDGTSKTIVITAKENVVQMSDPTLMVEGVDYETPLPAQICAILYKHKISSVIIEGGTKTIGAFIESELWDEARVFIGNLRFGTGIVAPELEATIVKQRSIKDDLLIIYKND